MSLSAEKSIKAVDVVAGILHTHLHAYSRAKTIQSDIWSAN